MNPRQVLRHCVEGMLASEDRFGVVPERHVPWLTERLHWHKIMPLAAALSDPRQPKSPRLQQTFEAVTIANLAREGHYRTQAREVIGRLRAAGIDVIPYKGPFWGARMYPGYSWRNIGDLDLLMTNAEARAAAAILSADGYRPDVVGSSEADDFERRGELTFFPPPSQSQLVPVQLHWELMPAPRFLARHFIRYEDFANATATAAWESIAYRLPAAEIRLLYLALHATCQHQFMRFVHIIDQVYFLRAHPALDWDAVRDLARERHCQTPLYYALAFAGAFWRLPAAAEALLADGGPRLSVRLVASLLRPHATLFATAVRGKRRRKLFRAAMSW